MIKVKTNCFDCKSTLNPSKRVTCTIALFSCVQGMFDILPHYGIQGDSVVYMKRLTWFCSAFTWLSLSSHGRWMTVLRTEKNACAGEPKNRHKVKILQFLHDCRAQQNISLFCPGLIPTSKIASYFLFVSDCNYILELGFSVLIKM